MASTNRICCADFTQTQFNRRALLKVGGLGMLGISQADLLRAEAEGKTGSATARSVILLFQFGGPSHIDTFDPKPKAPQEIRGGRLANICRDWPNWPTIIRSCAAFIIRVPVTIREPTSR